MAQKVREVMTPSPMSLRSSEPLTEAARIMRDHGVGSVLVIDDGELQGLVTDRDIVVRAVADDQDPASTPISEVCSSDLIIVGPDDDADMAVIRMRERAVRRIPVVDDGIAIGIVSIGDMAIQRDEKSALADISAQRPNT
jgi:signal-transduction protein with cAMP-binding, CBS, and nucleotidyltransferase domain